MSGGVQSDIYFSFAISQLVHHLILWVTDSEEYKILRLKSLLHKLSRLSSDASIT